MGLSSSAGFVIGVALSELFISTEIVINQFDEHDIKGNKTGKKIKEEILTATLPNNTKVTLATDKKYGSWDYNYYDTLNFDGEDYVGNKENIDLQLHRGYCGNHDLDEIIIGISVSNTGNTGFNDSSYISKINPNDISDIKLKVVDQLYRLFKYTSDVNFYVINHVS